METLNDDILGVDVLDPHHVKEHVVSQMEGGVEGIRLSFEDLLGYIGLKFLVCDHNCDSLVIEASTTSTATHLNEFTTAHPAVLISIEFLNGCEDYSLSRHVNTHTKGLCGEQDFEETFLEEQLDDLFDDRKKATVMDADTSLQKRKHQSYCG